ncbi:hypothetical protein J2S74_000073 [Evansella vedderi]|uniref:Uncharacterized protein n=1 Tax=Evansella vedderi TaxID=38282 RepID=A0ABT9ZPQ2_9BACI|nr:gluconate 2-dehydrogenase subunit 3 family protein [Evansella vedderi]MDQ0252701.1 hypothetical protein [Evansella vedderi]
MNNFEETPNSTQDKKGTFLKEIKDTLTNFVSHNQPASSSSNRQQLPMQMGKPSIPHTKATFMAFVDVMIPSTFGALDLRLDDYVIWSLDHYISVQGNFGMENIQLSSATAGMLDAAAKQLIFSGNLKEIPNYSIHPEGGAFAALSFPDRLEVIHLLENGQVDMESLPLPYRNNIGFVKNILTNLHQMVMIGYYSEWFSHGATRIAPPENRRLERPFLTWYLVNYPGPSLGYRDLRGFLVKEFKE